jgi:hypothetical protein
MTATEGVGGEAGQTPILLTKIPARVIEADSARAATFTFAVCEPYAGEG